MSIKTIIGIIVLLILGTGFALAQSKKKTKGKEDVVTFDVSMTCENCKKRIEKNIAFEKGVTDMSVNLPQKTVKIKYKEDKTSPEKLQAAIEKLGYNVNVHQDNSESENK